MLAGKKADVISRTGSSATLARGKGREAMWVKIVEGKSTREESFMPKSWKPLFYLLTLCVSRIYIHGYDQGRMFEGGLLV